MLDYTKFQLLVTVCVIVILAEFGNSHPQNTQNPQYIHGNWMVPYHFLSSSRFPKIFGLYSIPTRQLENSISYPLPHLTYQKRISSRFMDETMLHHSIRICPEQNHRFDPITGTCQTIGTNGACGPHMVFMGNEQINPEDRMNGHCECDYDLYDHPLVSIQGQCHFLFTQAVCLPGYWLTMSSKLGPVCKVNPCQSKVLINGSGTDKTYALYKGECVKLNSFSSSNLCSRDDEVLMFTKGSIEPTCRQTNIKASRRLFRRQIFKLRKPTCKRGTILNPATQTCHKRYMSMIQLDDE